MLRLSNAKAKPFQGQPYTRLDSSKRVKDYFKVSVIQGLIATKGLKAGGVFKFENKPEEEEGEEKKLLLRAPLVAIGAQKVFF